MPEKRSKTELPESEEEWKELLTPEEYRVLREQGTEPKFTGEFLETTEELWVCISSISATVSSIIPEQSVFRRKVFLDRSGCEWSGWSMKGTGTAG